MLFELAITLATTFMAPIQNKPAPARTEVIYVKENKEPCTGVAPMECLQVKGVNDADWSNFYTNINGFKYVPGYRYKLRVRITPVKNPPADAPNVKYTLTKVLEKKRIRTSSQLTGILNKKWVLVQMDDANISDGKTWLEFDATNKRVSGNAGCNRTMGSFSSAGNNITFSKMAGTLMACADRDIMQREGAFQQHLGDQTFKYEVVGSTVNLIQNGKTVMQFNLQPKGSTAGNASIIGKKLTLTQLNDESISNSGVWIELDAKKKNYHGKGGCNGISGGYTMVGNKISFTRGVSTMMACPDADVMRRESAFQQLLGGHSFTYSVDGETVTLSQNGKAVMQFAVEDANPDSKQWAFIANKKWNVIKMNDATLTNAGMWVEFDTDKKRFHGKGGCNSISGGYNATKEEIKFSAVISTRMACLDATAMRRETEFIKLLSENTYRYDVADQTLNLYKDGKIILMFGMQDK